jgi:hypothetical protein
MRGTITVQIEVEDEADASRVRDGLVMLFERAETTVHSCSSSVEEAQQFRVHGVDLETGERFTETVEAIGPAEAEEAVEERGKSSKAVASVEAVRSSSPSPTATEADT